MRVEAPTERPEVAGNMVVSGQVRTGAGISFADGTSQLTAYIPTGQVEAAQLEVKDYMKLGENSLYLVSPNTNIRGALSGPNYELYTNDALDLYLQSKTTSGNVIIGSEKVISGNHTDFKLAVDGKAVFKHAVVTTDNWADFVFEKDYKLPALEEIKSYISDNGHLPDVPSEEEVIENGVDIAEMDALLQRKIGELTLYMIQLDEENKALRKEIEELKKQ